MEPMSKITASDTPVTVKIRVLLSDKSVIELAPLEAICVTVTTCNRTAAASGWTNKCFFASVNYGTVLSLRAYITSDMLLKLSMCA